MRIVGQGPIDGADADDLDGNLLVGVVDVRIVNALDIRLVVADVDDAAGP
jgi:hypothetical protein